MSMQVNLPEELQKLVHGTIKKEGRCLLCDTKKEGEFLRFLLEADDYEILAPVCKDCVDILKKKLPKTEVHSHPLILSFRPGFYCNICKISRNDSLSFCCQKCNYDCCFDCYYCNQPPDHENFKEINFEEEKMNFDTIIKENAKLPILVDFNAEWCGPCRVLAPILLKEAKINGYVMISVNVDKNTELSEKFKVEGIPQVNLFLNGEEKFKFVGFDKEKVEECFKLAKNG